MNPRTTPGAGGGRAATRRAAPAWLVCLVVIAGLAGCAGSNTSEAATVVAPVATTRAGTPSGSTSSLTVSSPAVTRPASGTLPAPSIAVAATAAPAAPMPTTSPPGTPPSTTPAPLVAAAPPTVASGPARSSTAGTLPGATGRVATTAASRAPAAPTADDGIPIGRITIPKLGIDMAMYEGITMPTLDRGPGHWPGTAMPGQVGNVVVAGHRVSHSKPFRRIDQLVAGDLVIFTVGTTSHTYAVTGHEVVTPSAVRIVEQTPAATATLFACHPPGSTKYRWVTHLVLLS